MSENPKNQSKQLILKEKIFVSSEQLQKSMKFSGKMRLMIILQVTKYQGIAHSPEDTFLEKPQREGSN